MIELVGNDFRGAKYFYLHSKNHFNLFQQKFYKMFGFNKVLQKSQIHRVVEKFGAGKFLLKN